VTTHRHEVARLGICGVVIPRPCLSSAKYRHFPVNGREVSSNYQKGRTSRINLEHMVTYILYIQGGSNMTGTDVARFTHKQSRSYFNHLVYIYIYIYIHILLRTVCITLYYRVNNEYTQYHNSRTITEYRQRSSVTL